MCFVWTSEGTATFALYTVNRLVFITEMESVYSAVRAEPLYKQIRFVLKGLRKWLNLMSCTWTKGSIAYKVQEYLFYLWTMAVPRTDLILPPLLTKLLWWKPANSLLMTLCWIPSLQVAYTSWLVRKLLFLHTWLGIICMTDDSCSNFSWSRCQVLWPQKCLQVAHRSEAAGHWLVRTVLIVWREKGSFWC